MTMRLQPAPSVRAVNCLVRIANRGEFGLIQVLDFGLGHLAMGFESLL